MQFCHICGAIIDNLPSPLQGQGNVGSTITILLHLLRYQFHRVAKPQQAQQWPAHALNPVLLLQS